MRILGRSEVCRWCDEREETTTRVAGAQLLSDLEIVGPVVRITKSSGIAFPGNAASGVGGTRIQGRSELGRCDDERRYLTAGCGDAVARSALCRDIGTQQTALSRASSPVTSDASMA